MYSSIHSLQCVCVCVCVDVYIPVGFPPCDSRTTAGISGRGSAWSVQCMVDHTNVCTYVHNVTNAHTHTHTLMHKECTHVHIHVHLGVLCCFALLFV